jgi:endonuclease/exonuclease/phosphatase family metal-dependent hydrolase
MLERLEFTVIGFDLDDDLRYCSMYVDGVFKGQAYFNSPTDGAMATWTYAFGTPGTHTVRATPLDLAFNFGADVTWTVEVTNRRGSLELTVLTYNTHLFEDSPLECIIRCGDFIGKPVSWTDYEFEDYTRRWFIGNKIENSGADIVALQEVWAYSSQEYFRDELRTSYPYSYSLDSSCNCKNALDVLYSGLRACIAAAADFQLPDPDDYARQNHTLGNGLVLLSKWPLRDIKFDRFPVFKQCPIDQKGCEEAWADKGVVTATVDAGGPIRIGISHALTGPDDKKSKWHTKNVGRVTFQLNGEAYIFSLNENDNRAQITRFEDYSYFDEASQTEKHGAGWKHLRASYWNPTYNVITSFELGGHPYLFALGYSNQGRITRINDDTSTGWTHIYKGTVDSNYVAVTSFELDGHPYLFGVDNSNLAHIRRINDDPCTGWSETYDGPWLSEYATITSFDMNGHPYIFTHSNANNLGHIFRINNDPCTGWSDTYDGPWLSEYAAITSFDMNGHPYIFTHSNTNDDGRIFRINNDPHTGWTEIDQDYWWYNCIAVKSFYMNGHPYLFAQWDCCELYMDAPGCRPRPGDVHLKRINDDPYTGWEDLYQLEDMKIIRDETVVDDDSPPAIMMGDFNIHRGKYGIMDELFGKAGAVDAYEQVADAVQDGNTIDINANGLARYFHLQQGLPWPPTDPDLVDRIDYVYVKQSGADLELVPTDANVDNTWNYYSSRYGSYVDLSDHYPLFVTFRLEAGCTVRMKGDLNCDRLINFADFSILGSAWMSEPGDPEWDPACDISEPADNFIGTKDVDAFAKVWLTTPVYNVTQDKRYVLIQTAINEADNRDEIEVAPGTYYEAINFKGKAIWLRSTEPNDSNVVATTVINGFGHYHVVQCVSGEDVNTVLDGFTITGGNANGPSDADKCGGGMYNNGSRPRVINCTFRDNSAQNDGAGMFNDSASPTVTGCTFSGNSSGSRGGGMYNDNASNPTVVNCSFTWNNAAYYAAMVNDANSNPAVTDCIFTLNEAIYDGGAMANFQSRPDVNHCTFSNNTAGGHGGGMINSVGSRPTVTDCNFTGNEASEAGGMFNDNSRPVVTNCAFNSNSAAGIGGAMYNLNSSSPDVNHCTFNDNTSVANGGGMHNRFSSNPYVTNCTFNNNLAVTGGGMDNYKSNPTVSDCSFTANSAQQGGGFFNDDSSPTVINCAFTDNSATISIGGGMFNLTNSSPTVTNCTFSGNSAATDGGGMDNRVNSNPIVTNCILWGNKPNEIYNYSASPSVTYSDIQGSYSGTGNIDADPCFVDVDANDLRLLSDSPCIDAGDNSAVPSGITTDLDDNPRFVDDPETVDTGSGTPPIVDMGAYEYLSGSPAKSNEGNFEYLAIICADWLAGTKPEL